MKTKIIYMAAIALAVVVSACKKEGCTDPAAINYEPKANKDDNSCEYFQEKNDSVEKSRLTVHFHPMVGSESFALNHTYTMSDGRKFQFTRAEFYVSGITLDGDEPHHFEDTYLLVSPQQMMYEVGEFDAMHYHGIGFDVGVDSATNHLDPATFDSDHPLAPQNPSMHWGWNPGYLFIAIEGKVDTTASMSGNLGGNFEWHVGLDKALRNVSLTKHGDMSEGEDLMLEVHVNYKKLFEGLDMTKDTLTHSMGSEYPLAGKVADNLQNAFMIQ